MKNRKLDGTSKIALVVAVIAFLLALSAVLVKYFRSGEFDLATLAGGIVIPGIVISLVLSRKSAAGE